MGTKVREHYWKMKHAGVLTHGPAGTSISNRKLWETDCVPSQKAGEVPGLGEFPTKVQQLPHHHP